MQREIQTQEVEQSEKVDEEFVEIAGREGYHCERMLEMMQVIDDQGAVQSRRYLAVRTGTGANSGHYDKYGYNTVSRLRSRGLVTLDPDHPDSQKSGKGAVVLTERGEATLAEIEGADE